ncbi:MAG TPA: hypothetical protein VF982_11540 [Anaerolineales bacterium]
MRTSQWLLMVMLGTLLGGCATTQDLSDEDRKKISVVRINSNVQKAPNMYYLGPGTAALTAFGAVGGAIAYGASVEPAKVLQDFIEKNGISIEKIVFQEIDAAIRQSGKLKVSDSGDETTPTINVLVGIYGFSVPHGFSSNLLPSLAIRCQMVDAAGKVIWSAQDHVLPVRNPAAPMSLEAMRKDPKRIEDAWRKAARRIAGNIAKTL